MLQDGSIHRTASANRIDLAAMTDGPLKRRHRRLAGRHQPRAIDHHGQQGVAFQRGTATDPLVLLQEALPCFDHGVIAFRRANQLPGKHDSFVKASPRQGI